MPRFTSKISFADRTVDPIAGAKASLLGHLRAAATGQAEPAAATGDATLVAIGGFAPLAVQGAEVQAQNASGYPGSQRSILVQTDSVENIFARAWSLLSKNPVIIVPGVVVGIVVGIIQALILPHPHFDTTTTDAGAAQALAAGAGIFASAAISLAVGILAFLITQTYTTGMAGAAWQTGTTALADGGASFREDAGRLLAAVLLLAVVGIVLSVVTFGLGWFVVLFFALYLVPAVVLDNYGAIPAFKVSARIAMRRVLPTIIIIVMLFVIGLVVGLIALPLAFIPFLGPIVAAVVSQAVTAYATLVIVGEYLNARRAPDVMQAGPVI